MLGLAPTFAVYGRAVRAHDEMSLKAFCKEVFANLTILQEHRSRAHTPHYTSALEMVNGTYKRFTSYTNTIGTINTLDNQFGCEQCIE